MLTWCGCLVRVKSSSVKNRTSYVVMSNQYLGRKNHQEINGSDVGGLASPVALKRKTVTYGNLMGNLLSC